MRKKTNESKHFYYCAFFSLLTTFLLCGCTAFTGSREDAVSSIPTAIENESGQLMEKDPQYIYYIKDSHLFRFNVNAAEQAPNNPSPLLKDETITATISDYSNSMQAEDGSFTVLRFVGNRELYNVDERIAAISNKNETAELVSRGNVQPRIQGNRLLIIETGQPEALSSGLNSTLYSYRPEEGKKEIIKDIFDFYPTDKDTSFYFSRAQDGANMELYSFKNEQEHLLLSGYDYAGVSSKQETLYCVKPIAGEDGQLYYEMKSVEADGSFKEVLTAADHAAGYFLEPEYGNIYYYTSAYDENSNLYYQNEGERVLLTGQNPVIWDVLQEPKWQNGRAVILYNAISDGRPSFFAAVKGQSSELILPDETEGWSFDDISGIDMGTDCIYITLQKYDDSYAPLGSRIYRYRLEDGSIMAEPECVADGRELYLEKEAAGGIFYVDGPDTLYYDGTQILEHYVKESLLITGENGTEYFAMRQEDEELPDLMRLTTAGSSKIYKKNVVLCESYANGLILLTDCDSNYPYSGTLSFYGGAPLRIIDENVSVFYQHDPAMFVSAIPDEWYWSTQETSGYDPNILSESSDQSYIEEDMFYNMKHGFTLNLAKLQNEGYSFRLDDIGLKMMLWVSDGGVHSSLMVSISDQEYSDYDDAKSYADMLTSNYYIGLKAIGMDNAENDYVVEAAEDISLGGKPAFKLVVKTKTSGIEGREVSYVIPDEHGRVIDIWSAFYDQDNEFDVSVFEELVETLDWME